MSRPIGTADELERRRKQAVQAVSGGESRTTVAKVLGVHYKTVARWVRQAREPGGVDAKPQTCPEPGLSDADLRKLEGLLAKGAKAHGWHNQLWTAARVARLIERHFRITYHPEHVRKILKRRLGWTSQKPRRKARERDDKEVARWVGDEFPRIVREAWRRKAYPQDQPVPAVSPGRPGLSQLDQLKGALDREGDGACRAIDSLKPDLVDKAAVPVREACIEHRRDPRAPVRGSRGVDDPGQWPEVGVQPREVFRRRHSAHLQRQNPICRPAYPCPRSGPQGNGLGSVPATYNEHNGRTETHQFPLSRRQSGRSRRGLVRPRLRCPGNLRAKRMERSWGWTQ